MPLEKVQDPLIWWSSKHKAQFLTIDKLVKIIIGILSNQIEIKKLFLIASIFTSG
jgi:hypothetical protein